ncbi:MAG: putative nucleic acid-binding Zn-ribbon protein [Flavobacteriales bacterium]|jgi:predicted  nucleic acid-binding Zn-ribbon protein
MIMSFPLLISLTALIVSILLVIFLNVLFKRDQSQLESIKSQDNLLTELAKKVNNLTDELHEIRSGNYGVISRVKELVHQVDNLQSAQQNLVEQDPQSRFYSKGTKLISQGASLEDVMRECDMPVAEAELLFNLHNKQR